MRLIITICLLLVVGCSRSSKIEDSPISLTTNDIIRVETDRGGAAIIQFTTFGPDQEALYRWRYRAPQSKTVQSGTGRVVESFDRKAKSDGNYEVVPNAEHDTTVRAGDLMLEWSYGSDTNGFLYFDPSDTKIQLLDGDNFERKL
ncbi:MAG: hypothetical protein H0X66_05100 [Verrucomicrobia bacterium]|nr:hypothetical protein [Verrucomicrobiota bacterium]